MNNLILAGFILNVSIGAGSLIAIYVALTNRITKLEIQKEYITEAINELKEEFKALKDYLHTKLK